MSAVTAIERVKLYRKGLNVERMHTVAHITPYNNGSHSANAALIAIELCYINGMDCYSVIKYMLMHDIAEGYTGDIPANVKVDNPELKKVLDKVEKQWEERNLPHMPDLHGDEVFIAKAADLIELGMYCIDEIRMGNEDNMLPVLANVINYLSYCSSIKGVSLFVEYLVKRGICNGR